MVVDVCRCIRRVGDLITLPLNIRCHAAPVLDDEAVDRQLGQRVDGCRYVFAGFCIRLCCIDDILACRASACFSWGGHALLSLARHSGVCVTDDGTWLFGVVVWCVDGCKWSVDFYLSVHGV